ncbi:MAG: NAD-dependent epimerase/dehydratase family protein, partial [Shewanella sp.]|uniref:NAD-dependent epimerase/dehydratase family protein n=1 Tax=Shewanella sp. TaxID=50422 RepID=UPI003F351A42
MTKKMIALSGCGGFVGRSISLNIIHSFSMDIIAVGRNAIDNAVKHLYCDLNREFTIDLNGVDVFIHGAARAHIMQDSAEDPLEQYMAVNYHGTLNLARQAAAAGVKRFIFLSSIKVNGE